MRFFILGLVILNVVYFFWPSSVVVEERIVSQGDRGVPLLALLGESPEEVKINAGAVISAETDEINDSEGVKDKSKKADKEVALCKTVGPFRREEAAELATQELIKHDIKVDWRAAKERRTKGYAVFLPSYPSVDAAKQVIATLTAGGVDDHYIFSDAKKKNAISLGFFILKSGSEKRMKKLQAMGFGPQVEARFDEVPVFWLDYRVLDNKQAAGLWEGYLLPSNVDVLERRCK